MDELQKQLTAALADLAREKARADAAETALKSARADMDKVEAERDNARRDAETAKAEATKAATDAVAAAEQIRQDAAKDLDARVAGRVALLTSANAVLGAVDADGKPVDRSGQTDRQIKAEIVKHVDGIDVPDAKSEAYLDGMYEGALARHAKAAGSRSDALTAIHQRREDAARDNKTSTGVDAEAAALAELNRRTAAAYLGANQE